MTLADVFAAYIAIKNIANLEFICYLSIRLLTLVSRFKPRQMLVAAFHNIV